MAARAFPYTEPPKAQGTAPGTTLLEAQRQAAHRPEGWWRPGEAMAAPTTHVLLPKGCAVLGTQPWAP